MKRADPRELTHPPGYFYEPVRLWDGLNRYVPQLADMLRVNGQIGSAELSMRARDSREARLNGDDVDAKFVARGTITGMGHAIFRDKPHANTVSDRRGHKPLPETYEGPPCKLGHTTRYVRANNTGNCVVCQREKMRARARNDV